MLRHVTTRNVFWVGLALLAVLALARSHQASAQAYPTAAPKTAPMGIGPDGQNHQLRSDNSGSLVVTPSTGAAANTYLLINQPISTSVVSCPATPLAGRMEVEVCNSSNNSGSPLLAVAWDGTNPSTSSSTPHGAQLVPGQCITIPLPSTTTVQCVANAANTNAETRERK